MVKTAPLKHSFTYDGAQLNVIHANKGEGLPKHSHFYSHATICHNGSCVIRMEGKEKIINKHSGAFNLPANEWHEIEALEDDTVFVNVFAEGKY
jgi:quercetin dioxygenase-like cupin family protein